MFRCDCCGRVSQPGVKPIRVITRFRAFAVGWEIVEEQNWLPECVRAAGGIEEIEPVLVGG